MYGGSRRRVDRPEGVNYCHDKTEDDASSGFSYGGGYSYSNARGVLTCKCTFSSMFYLHNRYLTFILDTFLSSSRTVVLSVL